MDADKIRDAMRKIDEICRDTERDCYDEATVGECCETCPAFNPLLGACYFRQVSYGQKTLAIDRNEADVRRRRNEALRDHQNCPCACTCTTYKEAD